MVVAVDGHLVAPGAFDVAEVQTLRAGMVHRSDPNRSDRDRRALFYLYQPAGRPPLDERQRYQARH